MGLGGLVVVGFADWCDRLIRLCIRSRTRGVVRRLVWLTRTSILLLISPVRAASALGNGYMAGVDGEGTDGMVMSKGRAYMIGKE